MCLARSNCSVRAGCHCFARTVGPLFFIPNSGLGGRGLRFHLQLNYLTHDESLRPTPKPSPGLVFHVWRLRVAGSIGPKFLVPSLAKVGNSAPRWGRGNTGTQVPVRRNLPVSAAVCPEKTAQSSFSP